nr:hypothetical protein [Bacilli bacterium]
MNFRMNVTKINPDRILTFLVAVIIIVYVIIMMFKEFDFSDVKSSISGITKQISMTEVYDYIDNHPEYYYKIEGAVYCINKDILINSNEISKKFIDSMQGNTIEAQYSDNVFTLKYNDNCIER